MFSCIGDLVTKLEEGGTIGVDQFYIYKFLPLLPKEYYLIPINGVKNLLRPNDVYMKICPRE